MTSAANVGQANVEMRSALLTWRQSVERLTLVVDRAIEAGGSAGSPQIEREEFASALNALYALEASVFESEQEDWPEVA